MWVKLSLFAFRFSRKRIVLFTTALPVSAADGDNLYRDTYNPRGGGV
jgi:hypothetical protein